jgi:hypothetical protein
MTFSKLLIYIVSNGSRSTAVLISTQFLIFSSPPPGHPPDNTRNSTRKSETKQAEPRLLCFGSLCPQALSSDPAVQLGSHCINVFIPLVDITDDVGPTEFWVGTHVESTFVHLQVCERCPSLCLLLVRASRGATGVSRWLQRPMFALATARTGGRSRCQQQGYF